MLLNYNPTRISAMPFPFFPYDAATCSSPGAFYNARKKSPVKKTPISVLNCAIKRHEAEQEGGGERGFEGFFVMFCLHRFIHAAVFRHDSYSRFLARLLKPPFGIARLSYVDCL